MVTFHSDKNPNTEEYESNYSLQNRSLYKLLVIPVFGLHFLKTQQPHWVCSAISFLSFNYQQPSLGTSKLGRFVTAFRLQLTKANQKAEPIFQVPNTPKIMLSTKEICIFLFVANVCGWGFLLPDLEFRGLWFIFLHRCFLFKIIWDQSHCLKSPMYHCFIFTFAFTYLFFLNNQNRKNILSVNAVLVSLKCLISLWFTNPSCAYRLEYQVIKKKKILI